MTFRSTSLLILLLFVTTSHAQGSTPDPPLTAAPQAPAPAPAPASNSNRAKKVPNVCPNNNQFSAAGCSEDDDKKKCVGGDNICYRDLTVAAGKTDSACCSGRTEFCKITNMETRHSHGTGGWHYKYEGKSLMAPRDFKEEFYKTDNWDAAEDDGVACPFPYSYTLWTYQEKYDQEKGLPVDFKFNKATRKLESDKPIKKCTKNGDCNVIEGEFCDAAYNPSFVEKDKDMTDIKEHKGLDRSAKNKAPELFCYRVPVPEPNMHHVVDGSKIGLKLCNKHIDCQSPEQVCHIDPNMKLRNKDNATLNSGICMNVDSCTKIDATSRAVLNVHSQFCNDDGSCQGAGVSAGNTDYNPHCREYLKSDPTRKLCCFEKNPPCRLGQTETPLKKCKTMFDCANPLKNMNAWCDDKEGPGPRYCCKDMANRLWQCPDMRTPLFNEPKCVDVTSNINSGTCPKKGGQCLHGHCCPALTINVNASKTTLGRELYRTEFPCDPKGAVPTGFSYTYCDAQSKKLIVVGRFHTNGDKMTKVTGSKCTISDDCATDGSQVCVYENDQVHVCYYNPLRPLRPEVSSFWKVVLIVSLCCGGVFLISTIVCFVCYRSKSVFDKYRKKKGKGKSEAKSDNKKSGGKKGKGDKDKDKASDDGSSKKEGADASETGNSQMTDATGKSMQA